MLSVEEKIIFAIVTIIALYFTITPILLRYKIIMKGKPLDRFSNYGKRLFKGFASFFLLTGSLKKERILTGIVHALILYGFVIFGTVTASHFIEGFIEGYKIGKTHSLVADIFAVLVFIAIFYFMIRRLFFAPKSLKSSFADSVIVYVLLITVTLTFLLYEGSVIAYNNENESAAFFGLLFTNIFPSSMLSVKVFWWLHILNVYAFGLYLPRSKHFHLVTGPINIFFNNEEPKGKLKPLNIADEDAEVFGIEKLSEFTWKDYLDVFACIECGRCDDYCPALNTNKALSPKSIIKKLKDNVLSESSKYLKGNRDELNSVMGEVFSTDEIWACTTCGACMQVCPMDIEHVPKIIGLRQGEVLMEGKFPNELGNFFNGLNSSGDPWRLGSSARTEWSEDLDVPSYNEDKEYLLYLGCASTFDDRSKKVSQSLVRLLQKNNISFGILGANEFCCGETARRVGEEGVGQELMMNNINQFKELKVEKIITPCPHCFNTFKNEYPELGGNYEVIHHVELVNEILEKNNIELKDSDGKNITIHDSCYLGRGNGIYSEPRDILNNIDGANLSEHKNSKDHSFCCGAGGGLFWMEEEGTRINNTRAEQLSEVNPDVVATSCPYCMRMLGDGFNNINKENIVVKDIVEIVEEAT